MCEEKLETFGSDSVLRPAGNGGGAGVLGMKLIGVAATGTDECSSQANRGQLVFNYLEIGKWCWKIDT
jgi:hypothetical protein